MQRQPKSSPGKFYALLAAAGSVAVGTLLLRLTGGMPLYPLHLLSLSIVTFLLYAYDKAQSKRGGGRIPELVLHLLALAGGFPGGWAGRALFRHKTAKPSFSFVLTLATLLHAFLYFQLFSR